MERRSTASASCADKPVQSEATVLAGRFAVNGATHVEVVSRVVDVVHSELHVQLSLSPTDAAKGRRDGVDDS